MIGTILQLSAAFLFGYQIAFRNKKGIKESTNSKVFAGGKPVATVSTFKEYYDTSMYRIGFIYLIIGYLIPLTDIKIGDNLNTLPKIFLVIFLAVILVILGHNLSEIIAKNREKHH